MNNETQPIDNILAVPAPDAEAPVAAEVAPVAEVQVTEAPAELILGKFKSNEDLIKAYTNLEGVLGKRMADLSPEDALVLKGLQGRPASPDEYNLPEGADREAASKFLKTAHALGLSQKDVLELAASYMDEEKERGVLHEADVKAKVEANLLELKKEFGSAYEARIGLARQAALELGGEELIARLGAAGLGHDPVVIKALAKLGQSVAESRVPASRMGATFGVTPEEASREIGRKMQDAEFRAAYFSATHPGHKEAVRTMTELYELKGK